MNKVNFVAVLGLLAATGTGVWAQSGAIRYVPPPRPGVTFAEPWRPAGVGGDTKIIGTVVDIRQVPVGRAKVQLRNLADGTVHQEGESNDNGEYEFTVDNPGTYVVEMVLVDGNVIALSNAGSLARFETLRTSVILPGRWDTVVRNVTVGQNVTNFVGMSAATTMTATTMTLAANVNIPAVDSGESVSSHSPGAR